MWDAFPDHAKYPTLRSLHNFIGGTLTKNIEVPGFGESGNTCGVRMSRALNYGALPISGKLVKSLGISTMTGGDGMLYIFRVRELKLYIRKVLSVTPIKETKTFGAAFASSKGIVAFDVSGWSDASGHVALWDGTTFREPAHDDFRNQRDNPKTTIVEATTTSMTLWAL